MGFSFTEWQSGSHNPLLRYVNSKFPVCSIFTTSTLQSGAATAHLPQLCCTIKSCPLHAKGKGMCAGRERQEAGKLLFFPARVNLILSFLLLVQTTASCFSCDWSSCFWGSGVPGSAAEHALGFIWFPIQVHFHTGRHIMCKAPSSVWFLRPETRTQVCNACLAVQQRDS